MNPIWICVMALLGLTILLPMVNTVAKALVAAAAIYVVYRYVVKKNPPSQ